MISIKNTDIDKKIAIDIENTTVVFNNENYYSVVNSFEVYLQEREYSNNIRPYGNFNIIATNVLCDLDGEFGYEGVELARQYDVESDKYKYDLSEVLFQDNGWWYYINENKCEKKELEPQKPRFNLNEWEMFLTYSKKKNHLPISFNEINIQDGIAIFSGGIVNIDGKQMTYLVSPIDHNLSIGDVVNIYNVNGLIDKFSVYSIGLPDNTYKKNVFIINTKLTDLPLLLSNKTRIKKVINNIECEYYALFNEKLNLNFDIFKTAYSKNIYSDNNFSFIPKNKLDVGNTINHLNKIVEKLDIIFIKKTNDFWGSVLCCTNTSISNINYDYNTTYQGSSTQPINVVSTNDEYFFKGIYEYNSSTLTEIQLSKAVHVFNTENRINNDLFESYYYSPIHSFDFKIDSDEIYREDGINAIPDYATKWKGLYQWKKQKLNNNMPFVNNTHYCYFNFNIFLQRQDPCKNYNVGDNALIAGKCLNNEIKDSKDITKIC